jgi:hypothetical protein
MAIQKGFGLGLLHLERGQLLLRMDVQNIGNHNDRADYLDTNLLDFGNDTSFNDQSLARQPSSGRTIVLWAKLQF